MEATPDIRGMSNPSLVGGSAASGLGWAATEQRRAGPGPDRGDGHLGFAVKRLHADLEALNLQRVQHREQHQRVVSLLKPHSLAGVSQGLGEEGLHVLHLFPRVRGLLAHAGLLDLCNEVVVRELRLDRLVKLLHQRVVLEVRGPDFDPRYFLREPDDSLHLNLSDGTTLLGPVLEQLLERKDGRVVDVVDEALGTLLRSVEQLPLRDLEKSLHLEDLRSNGDGRKLVGVRDVLLRAPVVVDLAEVLPRLLQLVVLLHLRQQPLLHLGGLLLREFEGRAVPVVADAQLDLVRVFGHPLDVLLGRDGTVQDVLHGLVEA
mmetsp:Transcript_19756/g.48486  ORF Transcript_19756/g.48486 Transcript_19756/m.48486 type:complete len:318 (+) Transcript_19756:623-1576(+)